MTDNPSAYGALCALKPSFPSHMLISSVSSSGSFQDALSLIKKTLSIETTSFSIADLEQILLLRYAGMLNVVERFMSKKSAHLIRWMEGEFDLYNILILAKNSCFCRNNEKTKALLFHGPAAYEPPEPSEIKTIGDISSAYKKTCWGKDLQTAGKIFSETDDFALFELSLSSLRLAQLNEITHHFSKKEKTQIFYSIADLIRKVKIQLEIYSSQYPQAKFFLSVIPEVLEKKTSSHFTAAALTSPSSRFSECLFIRERIRLLCKTAAEKGTVL